MNMGYVTGALESSVAVTKRCLFSFILLEVGKACDLKAIGS